MKRNLSRRTILRTAGGAGIAGLVADAATALAEEAPQGMLKTRLGRPKAVMPKAADLGDLKQANISPDGQATSLAFDEAMELDLSEKSEANVATLVASLEYPVSTQSLNVETFRGFASVARVFVNKDAATRVLLTLDLGGTLGIIEFPYGQAVNGGVVREFFSFPYVEETKSDDGDTTGFVAPPPHFAVVVTMTIQRRSSQDQAVVQLESLDVEIIDAMARGGAGDGGGEGKPDGGSKPAYNRKRG